MPFLRMNSAVYNFNKVWSVKQFSSYSILKFGISCVQSSVKRKRNFKNPFQSRLLRQYFVVHLVKVGHWHPKITFWVDLVIFGHQVVSYKQMLVVISHAYHFFQTLISRNLLLRFFCMIHQNFRLVKGYLLEERKLWLFLI